MPAPLSNAPGFLVFSGANDRAVLALCRGFARHGVPFGLIARGGTDLLRKSAFADRFVVERSSDQLTFEDLRAAADAARARYGVQDWVLCATSEYLNIRLFELRDRLAAEGITVAT
ncbi:MAG TPA: hypothetical protein VHL57_04380, partial [Flavobacteriales bacterium]|nr:hypothetical protein [Flavobacteriales bacterium]